MISIRSVLHFVPHAQRATDGRSVYQQPGEWETSLVVVVGSTYIYVRHTRAQRSPVISPLYTATAVSVVAKRPRKIGAISGSIAAVEGATIYIYRVIGIIIGNNIYLYYQFMSMIL